VRRASPVIGGRRAGGDDVIRYVDSSGWTWAVCELADRLGANAPADDAADAAPAASTSRPFAPRLADDAPAHPDDPDGDAPGALYFLSRVGTRKLRGYPSSWSQLPRAGLEALCAAAEEVGGRAQGRSALA
jgi:hypothetical protein